MHFVLQVTIEDLFQRSQIQFFQKFVENFYLFVINHDPTFEASLTKAIEILNLIHRELVAPVTLDSWKASKRTAQQKISYLTN